MDGNEFAPGFRLSRLDCVVLVVGAGATMYLATIDGWWAFAFAFVVGHFFLFCNIVRLARPLELTWAAAFTVLAAATIIFDAPGWLATV